MEIGRILSYQWRIPEEGVTRKKNESYQTPKTWPWGESSGRYGLLQGEVT